MRRWIILLVVALSLGASAVWAGPILQSEQCEIPAGQVIEGNLFVFCQRLVINGRVTGDVAGAALVADINGEIDGSLYLASGRLNVRGSIGGSVHFAGPVLYLRPEARLSSPHSNLYSFALTSRIETAITGHITGAGYELYVGSAATGDVYFAGTSLTIRAPVAGSVFTSVGSSTDTSSQLRSVTQWFEPGLDLGLPGLTVTDHGAIGGELVYSGTTPGAIDGPVTAVNFERLAPITALDPNADFGDSAGRYLGAVLRDFIATLLIGVVIVLLAPRAVRPPVQALYSKSLPCFSIGLITFVLSFPAFLLAAFVGVGMVLLISLLGFTDFTITAAVVIGLVLVAAGALFYFTAVLISRVVVSIALARPLVRRLQPSLSPRVESLLSLALGGLVTALFSALPVIGIAVTALITFAGLGAMLLTLRRTNRVNGEPPVPDEASEPPPPRLLPRGPGTDNLPDGFNWWE